MSNNIKLKKKEELLGTDSTYDFEGSLDSVIARLQRNKDQFEKMGYTDIRLEVKDVWGYYDDHYIEMAYYGRKQLSVKEFVEGKEQCIKIST